MPVIVSGQAGTEGDDEEHSEGDAVQRDRGEQDDESRRAGKQARPRRRPQRASAGLSRLSVVVVVVRARGGG